ncbi:MULTISPECIES: hypothetical protein, partial [unclassified Okeania]
GRRKKEEERGKRKEGYPRKKKPSFPVDIHPWVYTNDINGHDIRSRRGEWPLLPTGLRREERRRNPE